MRIRAYRNKYVFFTGIMLSGFCHVAGISGHEQVQDSVITVKRVMDETLVTATKVNKEIISSSPVFSIDDTRILRTGITDISDAIHRLPGVTLKDYGGAGGMKTVSVRGLGSAHTAVVYDGLPLSEVQTSSIDLSRFTVDNIGELSLIIGDNNDIFIPARTAAAPALLNIATPLSNSKRPTDLTLQLKAGSFGYVSPFIRLSQRIRENWRIGVTGEYLHTRNDYPFKFTNGNLETVEKRDNNRINSGHIETNSAWTTPQNGLLTIKIYYYDNDRQLPGPVLYYNVSNNKEHLRDRNFFAQGEFIHPFSKTWKMRLAGKFNWAASLYTDFGSRQSGNYVEEDYFQREYYVTGSLLFNPDRTWSFDYSADYIFNNLNSNLKSDAKPYRSSILQSITGKFNLPRFTMTGRIIESIYLNGSNAGKNAARNHNRLSPSLTMTGRLLNEGLLYARLSYKNIFRMPSFNEAYFRHYGSNDLKPESTDQIDFGLTYQLPSTRVLPQLNLTADIYRNWVRDRIVAVPYNMFIWTITNLNSVHTTGADVTINSTIYIGKRQQFLLTGTWSYQRAKINVDSSDIIYGKQVAYIPLNSGSFSLSYENPWVNAVVHGQGTSERYTDNSNIPETRLPGYFETGITLWKRFTLFNHKWEARFDIMNLLNKQYVVIARYPMPGRSFMGTLKFTL